MSRREEITSNQNPANKCYADAVPQGWILVSQFTVTLKGKSTPIPIPDKTISGPMEFSSRGEFIAWINANL